MARNHNVDLIILDMRLPDLDGTELLRHLKANPETEAISAVMVSANPEIYAAKTIKAGAQTFLSKPIYPEKILGIMDENNHKKP
jgi:CheY-like chemotaxis protein